MRKSHHIYNQKEQAFSKSLIVFVLFLTCLFVAGLQEGRAQPQIVSLSPPTGETSIVAPDVGTISMTFDRDITFTGRMTLRNENNAVIKSFNSGTADVEVSGRTITFKNLPLLEDNKVHYMQYNTIIGTIADLSGNAMPTWTTLDVWEFIVSSSGDIINPFVLFDQSTPSLTTHVSTETDFILVFNENIFPASATVFFRKDGTNPPEDTYALTDPEISINGNTFTLNLPTLEHSTLYEVYTLPNADGWVVDAVGNPANAFLFRFTTAAPGVNPDLRVDSFNPADNANGFDPLDNIEITFNQPIKFPNERKFASIREIGGSQIIGFSNTGSAQNIVTIEGNKVILNPGAPLKPFTSYYIDVSEGFVEDLSGGKFHGWPNTDRTTYNFRTGVGDNRRPVIVASNPADNATNVALNANVTVTFDENVILENPGQVRLLRSSNNSAVSTNVSVSGSTLTIDPNNNLLPGTGYYVDISITALRDESGNFFEGTNSPTQVNFTTIDDTSPALTSNPFNPADNATNVAVNTNVRITFNENIAIANAGQVQLRRSSNNGEVSASKTVSGRILTINPNSDLANSTDYYVFIGGTAIRDASGNTFAGISGNSNYNFTTTKANQTITFPSISAKTYGGADFNLNATASSGLSVSYTSSNTNVATVSGNIVTIVGVGSTQIRASQGGNGTFNAAANVNRTLTVNKRGLTAKADDKSRIFGEANPTLTITYTGFVNGDDATDINTAPSISTTARTSSNAGTYPITLSGGSDNNYTINRQNGTLTVTKADQTITFDPIADKSIDDPSFSVRANASSGLSLTYAIASGPATISGTRVTLDGSSGEVVVEAIQAGNINYNMATGQTSFIVIDDSKQNQTITFPSIADQEYGDRITISATASSGLAVSYAVTAGTGTLNGGELTLEGVGSYTVEAKQLGDATFNVAPPVSQMFMVGKAMLEARAEDVTIPLGADIPTLLYTTTGFKLNDNITMIDSAPQISTEATSTSPSGEYVILLTGGEDDLYDIDLINGTLTIGEALGLEELDISIYPNPTNDVLTIEGRDIERVQLFSFEGKEVAFRQGSGELNLDKLTSGVYMLRIEREGAGTTTAKIIKNN